LPKKINNIGECPSELQSFIKKIENFTETKISLISYGPDRNQTFAL
jgi:adenylosuccinate synthase